MSKRDQRSDDVSLYTIVDDDLFDEIGELAGDRIVHVVMWEDSLSDALDGQETEPDEQQTFDIDLYLEGGAYFELYEVNAYADPAEDPLTGRERVSRALLSLINRGLWLDDLAVDDDDLLVLILGAGHTPEAYEVEALLPDLYLQVGGWLVDEWDELPDG